ncbi:MAG: hypothetical protein HRU82_02735 [Nitrospira sp.]|nr:MAG: hypothetical protein HRU82_02735 [Nitrospira sp.]
MLIYLGWIMDAAMLGVLFYGAAHCCRTARNSRQRGLPQRVLQARYIAAWLKARK